MALLQEREALCKSAGRRASFMNTIPKGPITHDRNLWYLVAVATWMLSWILVTQTSQELDAAVKRGAFHLGRWTICAAAATAVFPPTQVLSSIFLTLPLVMVVQPAVLMVRAASPEESTHTAGALQRGDVSADGKLRARVAAEVDFSFRAPLPRAPAQEEINPSHDKATTPAGNTEAEGETGSGLPTRHRSRNRRDNIVFDRYHTSDFPPSVSTSTDSPPEYHGRLGKLLLNLDSCRVDADCFGNGRRCIQRRCWGFAGPVLRPFLCRPGDVCKLENLKGHFYAADDPDRHGRFSVKVYRGNDFNVCGRGESPGELQRTNDVRAAGDKISAASRDSADSHPPPSSESVPGDAQLAGTRKDSQELLEDTLFTNNQGGTCLALTEAVDCPLTPGSMPFSNNLSSAQAAGKNDQLFYVPAEREIAPLSTNRFEREAENSNGLLQVNHRYACNFPSALHPQAACEITLGSVPPDVPVGMYVICGCSGTDLNNIGALCASEEDFAVPVGRLLVAGFSADPPDISQHKKGTHNQISSKHYAQGNAQSISGRGEPVSSHDAAKQGSGEDQARVTTGMDRGTRPASFRVSEAEEHRPRSNTMEATKSTPTPVVDTGPKEATSRPTLATALQESAAASAPAAGRTPRTTYECSIGKMCSLLGIPGVALNSANFFVDFLRGQLETCPLNQNTQEGKRISRLPCQPYAAGSLCMVSLTTTNLYDFLSRDATSGDDGESGNLSLLKHLERQLPHNPAIESVANDAALNEKMYFSGYSTPVASPTVSAVSPFLFEAKGRQADDRESGYEILRNFRPYHGFTHSRSVFLAPSSLGELVSGEGGRRLSSLVEVPSLAKIDAGSSPAQRDFVKDSPPAVPPASVPSAIASEPQVDISAEAQFRRGDRFVATLCGCNSSETEDSESLQNCKVSVFLGYLVVYGHAPVSGDFFSTSVMQPDEVEHVIVESTDARGAGRKSLYTQIEGANEDRDDENRRDMDQDGDDQILLRSSSPYPRKVAVDTRPVTLNSSATPSTDATSVPVEPRSSPWRLLQYITGPAANSLPDDSTNGKKSRQANECKVNTDCMSGTGVCDKGKCIGFIPDKNDSRLFRCVEGYWCDIKEGQIEGVSISSKYEVIATTPSEPCGTARNLRPNESLFANSNKWICDASSSTSCTFRAGVGHRRNKSHTVEGVRLCGCPHIDINGDGIPCNHVRDFSVPLGRLGVQECLTNAHCVDNAFAYCIEDHCGGFLVSAAAAGVNAFTCIRNQQCTLQSIAAKSVDQALKVIPVAANFSCGAEAALDPEHVKTSALPCIADVNNDGVCDINLGVNRALGTTRLCGCSGQDLGGNGRACDEAKDFDRDLGLVSNVQCIINQDCPASTICAKVIPADTSVHVSLGSRSIEIHYNSSDDFLAARTPPTNSFCCTARSSYAPVSDYSKDLYSSSSQTRASAHGECVEDDLEPYIVSMLPQNNTFAVPPLSHVDLVFNENIKFGRPGAAILIANLQQPSYKYLITLPPNAVSLKRIAAPLLVPSGSGVIPRLSGAGSGAGGGATATTGEGGGGQIAGTGLFGRGQNHTGIITTKFAERDTMPLQHSAHRPSRNLGDASREITTGAGTEVALDREPVTGGKRVAGGVNGSPRVGDTAAAALERSRLKQPQQQDLDIGEEGKEERGSHPLKKKAGQLILQDNISGRNSGSSLLQTGGAGGWRRGGAGASKNNTSAGNNTAPNSSNPNNNRWMVELMGQRLRITPDKDASSLPLGEYRIGMEYGFVSDLVGNYNNGENNLRFTLAKDAGCPYLYVTGFATENGNCNGLYLPTDPMNEQASWQGGERNAFFIYWKREPREGGRPIAQDGNWIIDTNLEDSSFLAFADLHVHADKKQGRSKALPPSAIDPPIGAALQLSATTLLPLHPITLVFNKPMNYGHWAAIKLTPWEKGRRNSSSSSKEQPSSDFHSESIREIVWYADSEAGMRGNAIRIYNKLAPEVLPSPSSSVSGPTSTIQSSSQSDGNSLPHGPHVSTSLPAEEKNASSHETGLSSRLLQKRLLEPKQRVPLLSNYDSNQHLALVAAVTRPDSEASDTAAPSRAAAQAKANQVVGMVELHVQDPLLPGETYDFSVQLGALTDYSYNPWGPVESGVIVFHTTGGRCRTALNEKNVVIRPKENSSNSKNSNGTTSTNSRGSSSRDSDGASYEIEDGQQQEPVNYSEAYVVLDMGGTPVDFSETRFSPRAPEGHQHRNAAGGEEQEDNGISWSSLGAFTNGEAQDGTQVRIRCRTGYSVHASARGLLKAEETLLRCSDGRWQGEEQLPKCFRNCGVYPMLGGAYQMAGDVGGDGIEGEVIDVQCTNTAELLSTSGRQAVRCSGGKWDALLVKCGATCPPLGPALGSKYEVKQVDMSSERARHRKDSGWDSESAMGGRSARSDERGALTPETGEAKEGDVRRISCAPGAHSASSLQGRSSTSITGFANEEAESDDDAAVEEIRCGRDGWEQLSLQCYADCRAEQLAALLGQHGPGLEAAAGNFKEGRHGDTREIVCDSGFAAATERFSMLFTRCDDGRWLPLSTDPAVGEGTRATTTPALSTVADPDTLQRGVSRRFSAEIIPRPLCVPRCSPLQLPVAAYVVTSLPDVRGADGSTQQQVRVRCAAAAVAVGSEANEQTLTCSKAGVWELLTLLCKAPCKAPLLQLGNRYAMRDEQDMAFTGGGTGGKQANSEPGSFAPETGRKVRENAEDLFSHGAERLIGCAPGAAADGGAGFSAATQKIVCDDGLWQSAYRGMMRTNLRNTTERESNRLEVEATSIELKCRRGCGAPVLPQGVQPMLSSPRAVLLQRWPHEAELLVGCTSGFSATQPTTITVADSPAKEEATNAHQASEEASRHVETLICKDGQWEGLTYRQQHMHNRQMIPPGSGRSESGKIVRKVSKSGVPQRQLQPAAVAEHLGDDTATNDAKQRSLYLTLECRRDCAAADLRSLAQQQHFEVQQLSSSHSSPTTTLNAVSQVAARSLPHGEALHVICQKNFETLSGQTSEEAAAAITCSHGRLLLPRVICGRPSCTDGIQNGDETGVDCGGDICSPCLSCSDGIQNNDETGVDCGGSCPPCQSCAFPPTGAAAVPPPVGLYHVIAVRTRTMQEEKNRFRRVGQASSGSLGSSSRKRETGEETLFDEYRSFEDTIGFVSSQFPRGRSESLILPPGSSLHIQCDSEATVSGPAAFLRFAVLRCMPSGQWLWAADAAATTGSFPSVDVGGAAPGAPLQPQLICTPPTCSDGVRNGDETGVDCGGSCSKQCASCFNGVQDGEEDDVDCGGRDCEPCSSCSPRLLKSFLLSSSMAFAVLRRGAVVGTSAAAAAGISSSNIPSAQVLDQDLAQGVMHRLLTAHGQQLQIKCRPLDSASSSFPKRGVHSSSDDFSSSLAAASAGTYYIPQQQQLQSRGVKQPLPLTVHCRHGIWTTPAVAAASALALTKNAGGPGQQTSTSGSNSSSGANQVHQQDSWLARAALEAHQALDDFRQSCIAYRRSAGEINGLPPSNNFNTALEESDSFSRSQVPVRNGVAFGSPLSARPLSNGTRHKGTNELYWDQPQFAMFGVPDFRLKPSSAAGSSDRGETGDAEGDACTVRLIETFRASLRGECGALAFGSSSLKISSFCSNSCRKGLEAAIETATQAAMPPPSMPSSGDNSSVDSCSSSQAAGRTRRVAEVLQELLDIWCMQRNGNYCFAEAEASFALVQQLYFLIQSGAYYESELVAACPADSCFRSNMRHIVLLAQLSNWLDIYQPVAGGNSGAGATILNPANTLRRSPLHSGGSTARRLRQQQQEKLSKETLHEQPEVAHPVQQHQLQRQRNSHSSFQDERNERMPHSDDAPSSEGTNGGSESSTSFEKAEYAAEEEIAGLPVAQHLAVEANDLTEGDDPSAPVNKHNEEAGHTAPGTASGAQHNLTTCGGEPQNSSKGRRLFAITGRREVASDIAWDEGGTRRFLSDITHLPQIMDLLCMRVEGHSCAPEVLRIGMNNPVMQSPAADTEETQRICMRDPCVLEVVRMFGQTLMDAADASIPISKPGPQEEQQSHRSSSSHSGNGSRNSNFGRGSNWKGTTAHQEGSITRQQFLPPYIEGNFFGIEGEDDEQRVVQGVHGMKVAAPAAATISTGSRQEMLSAQGRLAVLPSEFSSSIHPRDVVLGMLMKYWGRTFCHRNVHGALCGGLVFPSKETAILSHESRPPYPSWTLQTERKLSQCKCPNLFIGDGDCDISCFSAECEWDRGDCLATELVFPVYRHLVNQIGKELGEPCNPFNAVFTCGRGSRSHLDSRNQVHSQRQNRLQYPPESYCAAYFSKLAESRGCCLATQLEVLHDLLEADMRILAATTTNGSPALAAGDSAAAPAGHRSPNISCVTDGQQMHHAGDSASSSMKAQLTCPLPPRRWQGNVWLQLDRSSSYFEFACQQQMDRTCSRGLSRFAYAVELKIEHVNYDDLLTLQPPAPVVLPDTEAKEPRPGTTSAGSRALGKRAPGRKKLSAEVGPVTLKSSRRRRLGSEGSHSRSHSRQSRAAGSGAGGSRTTTDLTGLSSSRSSDRSNPGDKAQDEGHQEGSGLNIRDLVRESLLSAEASPKLQQFRHLLREELAAIFSVPAADVIEMRLWRGSIDVHSVVDAGWLSNKRTFKEHVEALTADPSSSNSLSARLSAGLKRHLSSAPFYPFSPRSSQGGNLATELRLPLLALILPTFPRAVFTQDKFFDFAFPLRHGKDEEAQISVAPKRVFVERVPLVQQLRYHPGAAVASVAMTAPPFGTFSVSELPTGLANLPKQEGFLTEELSSTKSCALELPEQVECNSGHEAIAGESPQELVCNQGRWEPLSSLFYAYPKLQAPMYEQHGMASRASFSFRRSFDDLTPPTDNGAPDKGQIPLTASHLSSSASGTPARHVYPMTRRRGLASRSSATTASSPFARSAVTLASSVSTGSGSAVSLALQPHISPAVPQILLCRRPCLQYEKVDPSVLRAEFVISGVGASDGDKRNIFCAPGYSPRDFEAFPNAQQTLTCINGVWLPPRTLVCEKDFAAVSGSSSSSPCSGALSGLEERYRLTEVPLASSSNLDISAHLDGALNARLQPKGVSVQVFKITCARGYTHQHGLNPTVALSSSQQQSQYQGHPGGGSGRHNGEVYVACLDGDLIGFGTDELFPHGGSAEGHRAAKLAAAFEMRLWQHSGKSIKIPRKKPVPADALVPHPASASSARPRHGDARSTTPARTLAANTETPSTRAGSEDEEKRRTRSRGETERQLQANIPEKRYLPYVETGDADMLSRDISLNSVKDEESPEEEDYIQRHLTCERDVRMDPPVGAKPISDTVMVFLCLLVLFALTVFFLTGWWIWNTKKKRRAQAVVAKALSEQGGRPPESGVRESFGSFTNGEGDEWNSRKGKEQYEAYYMRNTATSLTQGGDPSSCGSGTIMHDCASSHRLAVHNTGNDLSGAADGESERLLLSRYYWMAAAAAAAEAATAATAPVTMEDFDGHFIASTNEEVSRELAIEGYGATPDAPPSALRLVHQGEDHNFSDPISQVSKSEGQLNRTTISPHLSSPNGMLPAVAPANLTDSCQESRSPQRAAILQLLLRHVNDRGRQEQLRQTGQKKSQMAGELGIHEVSDRLHATRDCHRHVIAGQAQKDNESIPSYFGTSNMKFNGEGDYGTENLSPVYLKGLPGDHGTVLDIKEHSTMKGKGNPKLLEYFRATGMITADAGEPAYMGSNVRRAQQIERDAVSPLRRRQQPQELTCPPSYEHQQMRASEGQSALPSLMSYSKTCNPNSTVEIPCGPAAAKGADPPRQSQVRNSGQLPLGNFLREGEKQFDLGGILQQNKQAAESCTVQGTTSNSQPPTTGSMEREKVDPLNFTLDLQASDSILPGSAQSAPMYAGGVETRRPSSHEKDPPAHRARALNKCQPTLHHLAQCAENRHPSISTAASLELIHAHLAKRQSNNSSCSARGNDRSLRATDCGLLADGGDLHNEQASRGTPAEDALAVEGEDATIAGPATVCAGSSNRFSPKAAEGMDNRRTRAATTSQRTHEQHRFTAGIFLTESCGNNLSLLPAATTSSEDEVYPEDSASCVGQKGYRARRARRMEYPSASAGVISSADIVDPSLNEHVPHLPSQELRAISQGSQIRRQQLTKQGKAARERRHKRVPQQNRSRHIEGFYKGETIH